MVLADLKQGVTPTRRNLLRCILLLDRDPGLFGLRKVLVKMIMLMMIMMMMITAKQEKEGEGSRSKKNKRSNGKRSRGK